MCYPERLAYSCPDPSSTSRETHTASAVHYQCGATHQMDFTRDCDYVKAGKEYGALTAEQRQNADLMAEFGRRRGADAAQRCAYLSARPRQPVAVSKRCQYHKQRNFMLEQAVHFHDNRDDAWFRANLAHPRAAHVPEGDLRRAYVPLVDDKMEAAWLPKAY